MICETLRYDLDYTFNKLSSDEKEKLCNSTILITGFAGFIGYYFMRFFQHNKMKLNLKKVIAIDNFMLGCPKWVEDFKEDSIFQIEKFDISKDNISDIKDAENVDYVIHMASIASPTFYRKFPIETIDANIWGLRSLLEFYKEKSIKGFLFYSSSEVYGNPDSDNIPTAENYNGNVSITGPRSCYDESKRFGETICMLFSEKYNMPIGVVRPFNNYGPGMKISDKRVPADFAKAVKENRNIEILSNGLPTRTFCYIADAVNGYLKILLYGKYDFFNIGIANPEISIEELANIYKKNGEEVFKYTGNITYNKSNEKHYLTHNPQHRCPNIDKAKVLLNYKPEIDVTMGVKRFLKFIKESEEYEYLW